MNFEYLREYLVPYWKGTLTFREAVLFRRAKNGDVIPASLLYPPQKILSVISATTEITYREGQDYLFDRGMLTLTPGSSIPCQSHEKMYPPRPLPDHSFQKTGGGNIYFSEGEVFHRMQTLITYTHREAWDGPIPSGKGHLLPHFTRKMRERRPLQLLILGDSISEGANSSGPVGMPPYLGSWWQMAAAYLEQYAGIPVACRNISMGGQMSAWGAEKAEEIEADYIPDLCFIAFGMNDGSHKVPPGEFREHIASIVSALRRSRPETEFVLVGSILPNPEAEYFAGFQRENRDMLLTLEETGAAVADVTAMHEAFLKHKPYCDISGNNVNHLNDCSARLQAQVVLQTLGITPV